MSASDPSKQSRKTMVSLDGGLLIVKAACTLALLGATAAWALDPVDPTASSGGTSIPGGTNPAQSAVNWTPVLVRASTAPQLFRGSDGKYNLVYELVLTNISKNPANLTEVSFLNAETGVPFKTLTGKELTDVTTRPFGGGVGYLMQPGAVAILWANLEFDNPESAPKQIDHRITFTGKSFTGIPRTFNYRASSVNVNSTPPLVISPPLRGGKWIAIGGYKGTVGHRRTLFPIDNSLYSAQRYAIDWLRIDENGFTRKAGDKSTLTNSASYGQPVYAVADATVYGVTDRFPEQTPYKPTGEDRYSYPAGNSVVLDLGNNRYAMYAHLKPGSIKVKTGDRVKRGDVIAELGNSGNSTSPHLHMHVTDSPSILGSSGVPYVFDKLTLAGQWPGPAPFFAADSAGQPHKLVDSSTKGVHENELPTEGHIVEF